MTQPPITDNILFGKTLEELKGIAASLNLPAFNARIIAEWLYKKNVRDVHQMTNLSKKAREALSKDYAMGMADPVKEQVSADGTKKYLYTSSSNKFIETAYIPDRERATLCVSSQVGCKMGCLFCMTARQGFQGNLSAGEILNQFQSLPEKETITNIVYMGMGEPFDNLTEVLKSLEILTSEWGYGMSTKRITVSTIGVIPGIKEFLDKSNCHLAISLHTPFNEERKKLMPIENVYPLDKVIAYLKTFEFTRQRRVSFEYIMFKGINDTQRHVQELNRILNGIKCRINLIKFHPIPGTQLKGSDAQTMEYFRDSLNAKGIIATIRASRGEDIYAACGLLSTKEIVKPAAPDF